MAKRRKLLGGGTKPIRPDYFFDENDVDITGGSPEPTVASTPEPEREGPVVMNDKRFSDAFKNARVSGADTFMWKGREYSTRMKGESGSTNTSATNIIRETTRPNSNATTSNSRNTNNRTVAPARRGTRTQVRTTGPKKTTTSKPSSGNSRRTASTAKRATRSIATTPPKPAANTATKTPATPTPALARKAAPKAPSDFYEARKIAQSQGKKSFNWKGQTYSAYGATSPVTKPNHRHMKLFRR